MNIGLDFDGVIADCSELKSRAAKIIYGVNIPPEKFNRALLIGEGHLSEEDYRALQYKIYETEEFGFLMDFVPDADIFLPRLIKDGHTILIITSRKDRSLDIAQKWSRTKGLELNFVGVGYERSKAEAARGIDFYIDDDLDKIEPLVNLVPHRYLFSWGYNNHIDSSDIALRIYSWMHLYQTIQTLTGSH